MKISIFIILLLLLFPSCSKEQHETNDIILEPIQYSIRTKEYVHFRIIYNHGVDNVDTSYFNNGSFNISTVSTIDNCGFIVETVNETTCDDVYILGKLYFGIDKTKNKKVQGSCKLELNY